MFKKGEKVEYAAKKCPKCGKVFIPHSGKQVYCSHECYLIGVSERTKAHRAEYAKKCRERRMREKYENQKHEDRLNWGLDYGRKQAEETLEMVGRVRV